MIYSIESSRVEPGYSELRKKRNLPGPPDAMLRHSLVPR